MGHVLIAGCGYLGIRVARRLDAAGTRVTGLRRSGGPSLPFVEMVATDLALVPDLARLPGGITRVMFSISTGGRARTEDDYRAGFLDPLRHLIAHGRRHWPDWDRLVLVSSTGVYARTDGAWVDEDSDAVPDRPAGKILLEAEALAAAEAPGPVALRLAGIYGPGRERLVTAARRGECATGESDRWLNQIHGDDAAALAGELLTLPSPPPVVVGVDREPARRSEVLGWLRDHVGVPADPTSPTPPSRDRGSKRCRSRWADAPWYRLAYPTYREGYAALLAGDAGNSGPSGK